MEEICLDRAMIFEGREFVGSSARREHENPSTADCTHERLAVLAGSGERKAEWVRKRLPWM